MSDWRSRAKKVDLPDGNAERVPGSSGTWRVRAKPIEAPGVLEMLANPKSVEGTALQQFGQGASFGLTDELSGAAGVVDELGRRQRAAMGIAAKDGTFGGPIVDEKKPLLTALLERYRQERNSTRADLQKGEDANPGTALAANILGAVMMPVPGPQKAAKGASLLSRAKTYGKFGTAIGAGYGAGSSDADLTKGEVLGFGGDILKGGGVGGVSSAIAGPAVEKAAGVVTNYLRESAADKAFRAMSGNAKIRNQAREMGLKDAQELRDLGRWALDEGLIPLNGNAEEIVAAMSKVMDDVGPKIRAIAQRADNILDASDVPHLVGNAETGWVKPTADYGRAQKAAKGALDPMSPTNMEGLTAEELSATGPAEDFIDRIAKQGEQTPGSFEGMWRNKSKAQDVVNWGDKANAAKKIHRDAVQRYTGDFEDQIGEVLGPGAKDELKGLNKQYSRAAMGKEIATEATSRAGQTKYQNPLAKLLKGAATGGIGAGAAIQSPLAVAASGGALGLAKLLENPAIMARMFDGATKSVAKGNVLNAVSKLSPAEMEMLEEWLRAKR